MICCDIIVPVYNAFECLKDCVESIIRNTNLHENRLILIDDKSTDINVGKFLNDLITEHKDINITVLTNDQNLGFVGTVNKGMKYSSSDVLLLNSDTEVSQGWLEQIKECAYSEEDIASVTPLSNNATLVSVPIGLQANDIPQNMTFDTYAELVEKNSFKKYPILPTAHGFCMYIKRSVLDTVGYFDEDTFGKGYGEENDFSYRCMDYGYKHVLCDNVIVYHKESQSFTESKSQLIRNNMKILQNRYPNYVSKTDVWLKQFPIKDICQNVNYSINQFQRKNVLFLVHDWSNLSENVGGTTLHCWDLINIMRDKFNFHVLVPENGIYKVYSYFKDSQDELRFEGVFSSSVTSLYNKNYKALIEKVIDGLNIGLIHIHHMIGHYFDVVDVAKQREIQTIFTIHDFYCLCPSINMLYNMENYCLPLKNKDCKKCLKNKLGINNNIIELWKKRWTLFLKKIDIIITPSNSTKEIIERELPEIKCRCIEHGIDIKKQKPCSYTPKDFNIAFVGVMAKHKGAEIIESLINNIDDKSIKFHIFGDSEYSSLKKNKKNYTYHGKYKRTELPLLLKNNNINLVCNLSIWPETYSYTLTETIASGVPVLSYDIGAVSERINNYGFGWVIPVETNIKEFKKILLQIKNDEQEYLNRINNLNSYQIKNVQQMAEDYYRIYNVLDKEEHLLNTLIASQLKHEMVYDAYLDSILNSRRWKLVSKIELPDFLKKITKKIIK